MAILYALTVIFLLTQLPVSLAADQERAPDYVTSSACAGCHEQENLAWRRSHHAWALKAAGSDSVLGDFSDAEFSHHGIRTRFFRRDGKYFVETDGTDGKLAEFEVLYAVGVEPLQQYLVGLEKGRLQALDIAWDTKRKRWFHLYPTEKLTSRDGLHWTGPYKNWNARCAVCHQTDFRKNYSPQTKSYQSTWSELTVGCEACHGPGEVHVSWASDQDKYTTQRWKGVGDKGLIAEFSEKDAEKEIQLCASCHSRRGALSDKSPLPDTSFPDHHRLALLRDGLYHADGQVDDEVYVYGSFLQSKMYGRGVRCSNCHEPHSGELVASGNAVCSQCHSPAGNPDFVALKKTVYDDPSHHRHQAGGEGAQCVNCHMPAKTYMRVDPRRDHSFRVPRPDLSEKLQTPNACNNCHQDQTAQWAASKIQEWFPGGRTGTPHYGELFDAARRGASPRAVQGLLDTVLDLNQAEIVRATALDLLRPAAGAEVVSRLAPLLKDKSDLVRQAALRLLDRVPANIKASLAAPLLRDPVRAVRLEAARAMVTVPAERLSKSVRLDARKAFGEYQQSLLAQADFPETQMQIAGLAMVTRNFAAARQALKTALDMDPQLVQAWFTLARIEAALGKPDEAIKTLQQAVVSLPGNGEVIARLGAEYTRSRDHRRAVEALERSLQLSGTAPMRLELLAQNHMALGDIARARAYASQLMAAHPDHQPSPLVRRLLGMQQ